MELEKITLENSTLRDELKQSLRSYPKTLKEYTKTLGPAIAIASLGSAGAQWGISELGYTSPTANNIASYIGGYGLGYTVFFGAEFFKNREKYPNGIISKDFGKFIGTFLAADYVADLAVFSPSFLITNTWLTENTDLNPMARGLISWNGCAIPYVCAMAGLHPLTRRITESINNGIKKVMSKIKSK